MKKALAKIVSETHAGNYFSALAAAQEMRSYIAQHFVSRGIPCKDEIEIVQRLEYWLTESCPGEAITEQVIRLATDLRNKLVKPLPADPLEALRVIFSELVKEDYPKWIESRSSQDWDAVLDDFTQIEELEPKFKTLKLPNRDAIYSRFREVLIAVGQCAALVATPAKSDKSWSAVTSGFSSLFQKIEVLFAPENLTIGEGPVIRGGEIPVPSEET